LLQLFADHKRLITDYKVTTNLSKRLSTNELLDNTYFDSLIASSDDCTPYDEITFISLSIFKKIIAAYNATSGYASIANCLGKILFISLTSYPNIIGQIMMIQLMLNLLVER